MSADRDTGLQIHLQLGWQLGHGTAQPVPPALFRLLAAIRDYGSLRRAAAEVGVSYRYAWGLLGTWAKELGLPLAELRRGRGANLTAVGEKLLWAERRANSRLASDVEILRGELCEALGAVLPATAGRRLRVFASHGLALENLREVVAQQASLQLELHYRGSLDSLALLDSGACDLAGFHMVHGARGQRLAGHFARLLDASRHRLIKVVTRTQGLMAVRANPYRIASVADLVRPGVRFVNRQPGSGTRLLFDLLLDEAGIDPAAVGGYQTEEFTHLAVAALVASGAADAGFGVAAAAERFDLTFVPVADESYFFAVQRRLLDDPSVRSLIAVLCGNDYRTRVGALGGYKLHDAGEVLTVGEACRGLASR